MILKNVFFAYNIVVFLWLLFFIIMGAINLEKLRKIVGLEPNDKIVYYDAVLMGLLSCVLWPIFITFLIKKHKQK